MGRLSPYIFFLLAILAFGMIALQPDESWQTEQVNMVDAVLITVGVLIGAHVLRKVGQAVYKRWKDRQE
ncbi:MAG: hypothetical protein CL949_01900 [Erythrobacter sp.]|nr:hypothetical protein [Erythrobacter sp.]|tara:strand:+ start:700 stop:906 length:207 start_codon:yes stop_codon:yes gene_type:complete